ncbi:putative protein N(5)-glutamine methyltransferase [Streptosporangium sp. NBC_01495]|uniref:putative protein N(5)-glutamine methyltransferase n=1 Tax=Streptosporangium sp. NBC_01495 TaxID=2903899 RepID=UPI002E35CE27|nr:putative protein N(5)-glutamine methyltransferase [Streptosporangium sp. NBC_01495]
MSASSSFLPQPVIVTRLRAAGCVFAEDEARLLIATARTPSDLAAMVDRRIAGLPLEHVLGWAEFCGLRIAVDTGVFVPRRRTEFLVHQAVALAHRTAGPDDRPAPLPRPAAVPVGPSVPSAPFVSSGPSGPGDLAVPAGQALRPRIVVDLCCGSGAVGAALVAALDRVELHAVDIDPAAVRCARRNVAGGRVYEGDLYEPLPTTLRGRVDILTANAPYVPTGAIGLLPPEARVHEPRVALDGGADGLEIQRRVTAAAALWLAPGGHLLIETSERQAPQTAEAFARNGLIPRVVVSEELDATVVVGTMPAPHPPRCPARDQEIGGVG